MENSQIKTNNLMQENTKQNGGNKMKETDYKKLSELKNGEKLTRPVFVEKITQLQTKKGSPYISLSIRDSESGVKANLFQSKDGSQVTSEYMEAQGIVAENIYTITLEKNSSGFINVVDITADVDAGVSIVDFVKKSEGDPKEKFNVIMEILKSTNDEEKAKRGNNITTASDIAIELFDKYKDKIIWSAASAVMHSETIGGLLEHTEAMVLAALKMCEVYPDLNKDILIAATALHDIGKIEELNTNPVGSVEYTLSGIALGHIVIGYSYIDRLVQANPCAYDSEKVMLLKSMILSHHGIKEYGSPVEPIIKEAYVLHFLDQIDAKYHEVKKGYAGMKPGEVSQGNVLGINHKIYMPN